MENHLELPEDIRAEFKIDVNGKCFCSISGVARLLGVSNQTLSTHFQSPALRTSKLAQSLAEQGFDTSSFSEGVPDIALSLIAAYYSFHAGARCTGEAKALSQLFMAVGVILT